MTYVLLNLRDDPGARPVDDWVVWDLAFGKPVKRGIREDIVDWWKGQSYPHNHVTDAMFADAELTGTSSMLGYGCWNGTLHVYQYGPPGRLPRYNLHRFCDLVFAAMQRNETVDQISKRVEGLLIR